MEEPLALFGANTFTGPLVIKRGSVYLANPQALNGNAVNFDVAAGAGGNLFLYGNDLTISNLSSTGAGTARIANGNRSTAAGNGLPAVTLTIIQTVDATFAGLLVDSFLEYSDDGGSTQGPISIVKSGAATLTLSGTNTYTGSTTVSAGTLSVASLANGGASSGIGASDNTFARASITKSLNVVNAARWRLVKSL